ncbi:ferrochelatase [Photobacterium jeanii]|uniref:precorrin-2 dehydrogenase n=1 Tax=Photobacterium jeanii TaxID=858640 RepID=A0A178KL84_9GAMM|nr:NAD(P)-dependent oxidoreductase [Photobacterium jeanii]OAN18011.1 ferrochelatase [Photobacterium jeanii]PST92320.1 siroheme synthase [Photobacterium jeanii]
MDFFPAFLRLTDRQVLVVGGGDVACRKVDLLLRANANVTVLSPELHPFLANYVDKGRLIYLCKHYEDIDLAGFDQVWATTDQRDLNHQVYRDATARGLWVNVVDDPNFCHFITPSMVDRSPIQVAISSGGASPVLVRYLRERFETMLPQNLAMLADYAGKQRERIKEHFKTVDERRKFWERFFRLPEVEHAKQVNELESAFGRLLLSPEETHQAVTIVNIGRDPELLTLKALRLMQQAEYVLYSHDCPEIFVDLCRRDAERELLQQADLIEKAAVLAEQDIRVCVLTSAHLSNEEMKALLPFSHEPIFVSASDATT